MKGILIIGAGQMGRAAAGLLDPNRVRVLAFGDNDPGKWTQEGPGTVLVCSVEKGLTLQPEEVLISVLGQDRACDLARQVREAGFEGPVRFLRDSYELFDIRSRCLGLLAERIRCLQIPGAIAELGVYRGDTAWQLNALFPDRPLFLFDTFEGFDAGDVAREQADPKTGEVSPHAKTGRFSDTSAEGVLERMPCPQTVRICKGHFPETAEGLADLCWEHGDGEHIAAGTVWEHGDGEPAFALVSLDPDLYAPTLEGLRYFYPRMSPGGVILVHDFNNLQFEGVKRAVLEFEAEIMSRANQPLHLVPLGDLHGSCVIVR
ncbi:MAG: hypothetical protein IJ128_01445 [Firmicutes bacterium]|nr:hypothetical protein [Bacillota bacterium]